MRTKLQEYQSEVLPMMRALDYQKELIADFKASDEKAVAMAEAVKQAQRELKDYLETEEYSVELHTKKKELENDIKQAITAAAAGEKYKPAELKTYWAAKVKETVDISIGRGVMFKDLEEALGA